MYANARLPRVEPTSKKIIKHMASFSAYITLLGAQAQLYASAPKGSHRGRL